MALHGGDILDLMGRIQDAGYRAPCASSGAWMWDASGSASSQPSGGSGKPARWQTLRGGLLRATIVLLTGVVLVDAMRPQAAYPAIELAEPPTSGVQSATAQNAAQAQRVDPPPGQHQTQNAAPTRAVIYPHTPQVSPPRQNVQRSKQPIRESDQPGAPGGLDPEIVRRYVRGNYARIKYCYEMRRLIDPALAGVLETHFVILSSGVVSSATAAGFDHEIADCVVDVIKAIEFPSSASDTRVKYPFHFMPADN